MRLKGTLPFLITEHYRRTQSCVMRWFHGTNGEYIRRFSLFFREMFVGANKMKRFSSSFYDTKVIFKNSNAEGHILRKTQKCKIYALEFFYYYEEHFLFAK